MAQQRYQTLNISYPAGTTAGTYSNNLVLDTQYERATGVTVYENVGGGIPYTQMQVRDDVNTHVSKTNTKHLQAGIDCPKQLRATPVSIRCSGEKVYVDVTISDTLTDVLSLDVVFTLERP